MLDVSCAVHPSLYDTFTAVADTTVLLLTVLAVFQSVGLQSSRIQKTNNCAQEGVAWIVFQDMTVSGH